MILQSKMSLFDAPEGSILVHGCNALGVWGSGIAAPFKEKYPRSFVEYNNYCEYSLNMDMYYGAVGTAMITSQENKRFVGCLITSFAYGKDRDPIQAIIAQTYLALDSFFKEYNRKHRGKPIYCNKFNSGMFKVPWNDTLQVLRYFVNRYEVDITVCDPDLP